MKQWQSVAVFLYFLLVGAVLLIAPWTRLWEVSVFADLNGMAGSIYRSTVFRIFVALLGAATLIESQEVYRKYIGRRGIPGRRQ
jgi:hypothetical protein